MKLNQRITHDSARNASRNQHKIMIHGIGSPKQIPVGSLDGSELRNERVIQDMVGSPSLVSGDKNTANRSGINGLRRKRCSNAEEHGECHHDTNDCH